MLQFQAVKDESTAPSRRTNPADLVVASLPPTSAHATTQLPVTDVDATACPDAHVDVPAYTPPGDADGGPDVSLTIGDAQCSLLHNAGLDAGPTTHPSDKGEADPAF
jgi:hypothetical protein